MVVSKASMMAGRMDHRKVHCVAGAKENQLVARMVTWLVVKLAPEMVVLMAVCLVAY